MHPEAILILFCLALSFTEISEGSKVKDIKSVSWVVSVGFVYGERSFKHLCTGTVIHKRWILTFSSCGDDQPGVPPKAAHSDLAVLTNNIEWNTPRVVEKDLYKVVESINYYVTLMPPIGALNLMKLLKVDRDLKHLVMQLIPSESATGNLTVYGWNNQTKRLMQENVTVVESTDECVENVHGMNPGDIKSLRVNETMIEGIAKRAASILCVDLREEYTPNVEMGSAVVKGAYVYGIAGGALGDNENGPYQAPDKGKITGRKPVAEPVFSAFQAVHVGRGWIKSIIPDLPEKPNSFTTNAGQIIEGRRKLLLMLLGMWTSSFCIK